MRRPCVKWFDTSQLSQSKKRVFMSMNSLPKSERFWQYSCCGPCQHAVCRAIIRREAQNTHLLLRTVDLPDNVGPTLIDFATRWASPGTLSLRDLASFSSKGTLSVILSDARREVPMPGLPPCT